MKYSVEKHENFYVLKIEDEKLDSRNAPDLKSQFVLMNSQGVSNIILDLSNTKYIDSSGLSSILVGNRLCGNAQGFLVLAGLSPHVQKMLDISQLSNLLNIADTVQDGADAINLAMIEDLENMEEFNDFNDFDDTDFNDFGVDYEGVTDFDDDEIFDDLDSEFQQEFNDEDFY